MRVLKLEKDMKVKICEAMGNTLIKIGKDEMSNKELDKLLKNMFIFFKDLGVDYELIDDINENIKLLGDENIMRMKKEFETTLERYNAANESYKEIEANTRLKSHFSDDVLVSESKSKKVKVVESSSLELELELDIKTKIQGSLITVEQTKTLLTFRTALKADQYEVNKIKADLEKGFTFSEAIKKVIKDTDRIIELAKLVKLQNSRSQMNEDTRNFLI